MPISDLQRISRQKGNLPRALALLRELQGLRCCSSFMNTGAHPDDETSAMLAALAYNEGISVSYACANRGEGGQNNISSHTIRDLGVIRTAEMERAADVLGLRLYWLSESPEDSIFDFGFSKSGVETLKRWGHKRTLQRFVNVVRQERPDIICTTFLDIPGQHGHHRAMTQLAHEVIDAAADINFRGVDLPVWQVKKLYLPAWSGAGDAYDDDLPPPEATLTIKASGEEFFSGWTFEQIGQQSRQYHRTQGMGRWISRGQERDFSLHLVRSTIDGIDNVLTAGLPTTLASLAEFARAKELLEPMHSADLMIEEANDAFPDLKQVRKAASKALASVRHARNLCPAAAIDEVEHRLLRKEHQLATVIRLASRVNVSGKLDSDQLRPGDTTQLHINAYNGDVDALSWNLLLPDGWLLHEDKLHIEKDGVSKSSYADVYIPGEPFSPALEVSINVDGETSATRVPLETRPLLLPGYSARISPSTAVVKVTADPGSIHVDVGDKHPSSATPSLICPEGWTSEANNSGFTIFIPANTQAGLYELELRLDGHAAATVNVFEFEHVDQSMRVHNAKIQICVLDVEVPLVRVAYVGGGNDQVADKLTAMGFQVALLSDEQLGQTDILDHFDTLVVGLFAVRTRPVLQSIMPRIHRWIEQGGNLVTLYHRPWDDWDENKVPPKRLKIGKPSLRWRVTDETAVVTHRLPDHPLLNTPNVIGETDWLGWHKERGLYFAAEWDTHYDALLSMADPDEEPHTGALLSARIGLGRHTHTSLILHHQMEQLVPGAFRLMANLIVGSR